MNEFIARRQGEIAGVLSGFDRLLLRGTLRALYALPVMDRYLASNRVLYKDFGRHVRAVSERLKKASVARAERENRPIQYLGSSAVSKEEVARRIAKRDGIRQGLICVLSCVEPCVTFDIYRCREQKQLQLQRRQRKCLHLYHYWMHPEFGFMHGRIQSWFPFTVQVCLNGREWLARQMQREGLKFARRENCFVAVEDYERTQALFDEQLKAAWPEWLNRIATELNPAHEEIFRNFRVSYYWSTLQSEWATDLVFRRAGVLRRLYPKLVHHALTTFSSGDVLRFLGRRLPVSEDSYGNFQGEVMSDVKTRQEGVRVKHWVNGNTIKIYDKAFSASGSVLRVETTIYQERDFQVYRPKEGDDDGTLSWRPLRRGIADLYRRAEVSQAANERYLQALASVDDSTTVEELVRRLEQPVSWGGKRVRGLRLFQPDDAALLEAISRGEFTLNGLRNRDLQKLLFVAPPPSEREARRRSALVSRHLRLLRAHGLLRKVPHTHRYQVTGSGRRALTAIAAARRATVAELTAKAA
jgi:hypothetical protein